MKILFSQVVFLLGTEALVTVSACFIHGVWFHVLATLFCAALLLVSCVRMMTVYFDRDNIALGIAWLILTGVWGYDVYADWRQFEPLTFKK